MYGGVGLPSQRLGTRLRFRSATNPEIPDRSTRHDDVMVSFTFATSALSAKGLAKKANCSFSGPLPIGDMVGIATNPSKGKTDSSIVER
jgi:hypothetical protein